MTTMAIVIGLIVCLFVVLTLILGAEELPDDADIG